MSCMCRTLDLTAMPSIFARLMDGERIPAREKLGLGGERIWAPIRPLSLAAGGRRHQ